jgi:hypothetical protein
MYASNQIRKVWCASVTAVQHATLTNNVLLLVSPSYMGASCHSIYAVGNISRYDLHSGAQDTVGLHDDVVVSTEFSQTTGK